MKIEKSEVVEKRKRWVEGTRVSYKLTMVITSISTKLTAMMIAIALTGVAGCTEIS